MSVKITYFVHGTTTDNEQDLATGWAHGELSELGLQQAKELGGQASDRHFDVVFCSDLKRAIDSARLAFGDKYEIIEDERLREANYGDFTQKPSAEFKKNSKTHYIESPFPGGESYKDVETRIASFLEFLRKNYQGKHIAIVAHQAPQLAMDVLVKGKTWEQSIDEDWRKTKSWQPGWDYELKDKE
jgi:broad specificity phosphatase PhoE